MNKTIPIYAGILFTVFFSALGLVFVPDVANKRLQPLELPNGDLYPIALGNEAAAGREVYRSMGCIYCHSQQVRPPGFGADLERGWGDRRTVMIDYIYEAPHLMGTMRTGPDLANVGQRLSNEIWHHQHLYDPQLVSEGSLMPAFRFLYEKRRVEPGREPPTDAIPFPEGYEGLEDGEYIVPTTQAQQLVAYLLSLDRSADIDGLTPPEPQP